jgi:hypothetical protein
MAVFELFRLELRKVLLAVPIVVKGKVSMDRLDDFLKDVRVPIMHDAYVYNLVAFFRQSYWTHSRSPQRRVVMFLTEK